MKIAMLAPIEEAVPPQKYGGTELVVYNLVQGLVKNGHRVTLFASGDSKTSAKLEYSYAKKIRTGPNQSIKELEAKKAVFLGESFTKINKGNFDILHTHINWRGLPYLSLLDIKSVHTLHSPLNIDYQKPIYERYEKENYITISNSQRKPISNLNYIGTVYNGIEIEKFFEGKGDGDYFAFLGRFSEAKGPDVAISAALESRQKLKMGAKIDATDDKFYQTKIKPMIDGKNIQYVGELDHPQKNKLLMNAKALIAPLQWEEPFGLYFVEAMASGTPVITFNRGSAPEIIKDGLTGYLVNPSSGTSGIVQAIGKINALSNANYLKMREDCRQHVQNNFTIEKMVDGYEKVYNKILNLRS